MKHHFGPNYFGINEGLRPLIFMIKVCLELFSVQQYENLVIERFFLFHGIMIPLKWINMSHF